MGGHSDPAAAKIRDDGIWDDYALGMTQTEVARKHSVSVPTVSRVIRARRALVPILTRAEMIADLRYEIERVRQLLMVIAESDPVPVVVSSPDGPMIVKDPDTGSVAKDHTGRIKAMAELIRASERMSKLFGLDEPTRVATTGSVHYTVDGVDMEKLK